MLYIVSEASVYLTTLPFDSVIISGLALKSNQILAGGWLYTVARLILSIPVPNRRLIVLLAVCAFVSNELAADKTIAANSAAADIDDSPPTAKRFAAAYEIDALSALRDVVVLSDTNAALDAKVFELRSAGAFNDELANVSLIAYVLINPVVARLVVANAEFIAVVKICPGTFIAHEANIVTLTALCINPGALSEALPTREIVEALCNVAEEFRLAEAKIALDVDAVIFNPAFKGILAKLFAVPMDVRAAPAYSITDMFEEFIEAALMLPAAVNEA